MTTDEPDPDEQDRLDREGAARALEKAHVIVDSLLVALREFGEEHPEARNDELEKSALVTVALMESFGANPHAITTIATAAIIKLDRILMSETAVPHLADDR